MALAGCSQTELHGFLPGFEDGTAATNQTERVSGLWVSSWVVLLAVGVITWGLMAWAAIAYRRRKGQTGLPVQMRYNMPIEIFYTIVPLILVLGMFFFTARDQAEIETQWENPDVEITAIGKQWSWDFMYAGEDDDLSDAVWTMGIQGQPDAEGDIDQEQLPTLVLPVGQEVTIHLQSRDVIHSFWIIDFLYKKDMYTGKDNTWSFIPTRVGEYEGKCAELCGEYHSMMLFNVKVVEQDEYDAYVEELREKGDTGDIADAYDRLSNLPGTDGASETDSEEEGE
ncbi:cytochrome c oxidase subunit II [Microbacterium tumbae]